MTLHIAGWHKAFKSEMNLFGTGLSRMILTIFAFNLFVFTSGEKCDIGFYYSTEPLNPLEIFKNETTHTAQQCAEICSKTNRTAESPCVNAVFTPASKGSGQCGLATRVPTKSGTYRTRTHDLGRGTNVSAEDAGSTIYMYDFGCGETLIRIRYIYRNFLYV